MGASGSVSLRYCRLYLGISLNLVIVRIGLVYGPYIDFGLSECATTNHPRVLHGVAVTTVLTVAAVYGYMKKPMKSL